jgi:hypothetical protein
MMLTRTNVSHAYMMPPDVAHDGPVAKHDGDTPVSRWLRTWYTLDSLIRSERPVRWYEFSPSKSNDPLYGHLWRMGKRTHCSRPPLKFRYVVCHYGQPFSGTGLRLCRFSGQHSHH